jgi:hypothetical protein
MTNLRFETHAVYFGGAMSKYHSLKLQHITGRAQTRILLVCCELRLGFAKLLSPRAVRAQAIKSSFLLKLVGNRQNEHTIEIARRFCFPFRIRMKALFLALIFALIYVAAAAGGISQELANIAI